MNPENKQSVTATQTLGCAARSQIAFIKTQRKRAAEDYEVHPPERIPPPAADECAAFYKMQHLSDGSEREPVKREKKEKKKRKGDFNRVLEPETDQSHTSSNKCSWQSAKTIKQFMGDLSLADSCQLQYPSAKEYSFFSPDHCSSSCIDLFLTSNSITSNISESKSHLSFKQCLRKLCELLKVFSFFYSIFTTIFVNLEMLIYFLGGYD